MTDQEKNKKQPPVKQESTNEVEDLLTEFGASPKKAKKAAAEKKPSAEKRNDSAKDKPKAAAKDGKKASDSAPAKKASDSTARVKNESAKEAKPEKKPKTETLSTADEPKEAPQKKREKPAEEANDNRPIGSQKLIHRILPYLLMITAIYVGLSLLLNLFCNQGNVLASNPGAHWTGIVGYYICLVLFGIFGPAAFVLPLLLVHLALSWRSFIDRRVIIPKSIAAFLFLITFGALIHIATLTQSYTVSELFTLGAMMSGGGVIGGKLGYLLFSILNSIGSMVLGFLLLFVLLFYFLGTTPIRIWKMLRKTCNSAKKRERTSGEEDAERAHHKARMDERIRKILGRKKNDGDEDASGGAVEMVAAPQGKEATDQDELAPIPAPQLVPGSDDRLFVPADVNRKLREAQMTGRTGIKQPREGQAAAQSAAPAPSANANPAQNRDAAIDPIFPKTTDSKQVRRPHKQDRNFDLNNVFPMQQAESAQPRRHAPVPPEVPLRPGTRATAAAQRPAAPAQNPTAPTARPAAPTQRPAAPTQRPAAPTQRPAAPTARPAAPTAQRPVTSGVKAPSLSAIRPQGAAPASETTAKPVIRKATAAQSKDFGLSSEEFEKLEATAQGPSTKSKTTTAKAAADAKAAKKAPAKTGSEPKKDSGTKKYVFPPISYLRAGEPMTAENKAELEETARQLTDTLASFHVKVIGVNYSCGPTVTRYEVVLAPGVRVRSILNLADDIALALRSSGGVRIEAPIPGTNAVGIEVPNRTRSIIYLRDLIESKEFSEAKGKLTACLGAGIAGESLVFDISKMPHLLIAGTTGSGKSVCINCIIMSLLYKVRPDEVKLILIDPKKVEFSIYKNIPHLMAPVVTTPKDAAGALQAAVEEMERRFELFENVGVRDLKGYNAATADDPDMPNLPHIVIIIDELADLMMTAKQEVETAICRIAQKARAAGMHLIIGTQRPSADVVTGLIKANVPSSIAFAVKSQIDSRVILDHGGAEALTGRGDMLFVPIGAMRDTRVQGAFVDDKEVEKICEFIRSTNGHAQYDEKFIAKLKELAAQCGSRGKSDDVPMTADGEKGDDPKYVDAIRVAIEEKRISTSLLQRKLEVGYSRAAKLIDRMQAEGIVSPPDGSKPRSILITPEEFIDRYVMAEGNDEATE